MHQNVSLWGNGLKELPLTNVSLSGYFHYVITFGKKSSTMSSNGINKPWSTRPVAVGLLTAPSPQFSVAVAACPVLQGSCHSDPVFSINLPVLSLTSPARR